MKKQIIAKQQTWIYWVSIFAGVFMLVGILCVEILYPSDDDPAETFDYALLAFSIFWLALVVWATKNAVKSPELITANLTGFDFAFSGKNLVHIPYDVIACVRLESYEGDKALCIVIVDESFDLKKAMLFLKRGKDYLYYPGNLTSPSIEGIADALNGRLAEWREAIGT